MLKAILVLPVCFFASVKVGHVGMLPSDDLPMVVSLPPGADTLPGANMQYHARSEANCAGVRLDSRMSCGVNLA
jgi:hypothetical protein